MDQLKQLAATLSVWSTSWSWRRTTTGRSRRCTRAAEDVPA